MNEPKLVFAGTMGAGKTTAISAISEIPPISTDVANTDLDAHAKLATTVALDYGEVTFGKDSKLRLYGTPGQDRFDFIWSLLARDALGVILLVDNSRPAPLTDLNQYLDAFTDAIEQGRVVIGVGRMEEYPLPNLEAYLENLDARQLLVPVIPVDVRRRDDVLLLIESLFRQIECLLEVTADGEAADDWSELVRTAREGSE